MGYVKKEKMLVNEKGRPYTVIGVYYIVKESDNMTAIYADYKRDRLITSRPKWSQAIKLANLLHQAYTDGAEAEKDRYRYLDY